MDDGSTENVSDIIERFSEKIDDLKYVYLERNEQSCRARTRNTGIRLSDGDYVILLDAGMLISSDYVMNIHQEISQT
ncbi:glycosyltransferase family 2 protein [Paenibacillus sp. L3-i20]|uniref:glycosyltransferase n=1 Tax=Paenibacillus sp. L3-i20 TaxID=2905833 RepID=UPI0024A63E42|nr:glycosyltransferase family A protein [Paenibacillus sp. L3-i20]